MAFNDEQARAELERRNKARRFLSDFLNVEAERDGDYEYDGDDLEKFLHMIYMQEVEVIADIIQNFTPDEIALLLCNVAMIAHATTVSNANLKTVSTHRGQFVN